MRVSPSLFLLLSLLFRHGLCDENTFTQSTDDLNLITEDYDNNSSLKTQTPEAGTTEAQQHEMDLENTSTVLFDTTTTVNEIADCPENFKLLTMDWCFRLDYDGETRRTFKGVKTYCEDMGAILPAITSVEVTAALMLERTNHMGISPFESFFLGLGCDRNSHKWEWLDGPDYDPDDAFFSHLISAEFCTVHDYPYVFNQFGTWSRVESHATVGFFVCAVRPSGFSESHTITSVCTDKWTQLPDGHCYQLDYQKPMNMYAAEMWCRSIGGHLPSIVNNEQSDLIQAFLSASKHQNSQFWIGLYCALNSDNFSTTIGRRTWLDEAPYSEEWSNFLDEEDDSPFCNLQMVDTFIYNGALKGKWQKQNHNEELPIVLCSRVNPAVITSSTPRISTPTSTSTSTATTTSEVTTTVESNNSDATTESDEPVITTKIPVPPPETEGTTIVTTTIITTVITSKGTSSRPLITSTWQGKDENRPPELTKLELILIVAIASIFVTILLIILLYYLCKRIKKEKVQELVMSMQKRFSRSNTHALAKLDEWEIRRQFVGIDFSRQLGRGAFGSVYLGRVYSNNIPEMAVRTLLQLNSLKKNDDFVAVKTLHETADRQAASEFMEEINIMKKIGFHERIVNMLGCVTESEPLLLIVEYCSNGDLLGFMRERRKFMLKLKDTVGDSIAGRHSVITHKQQLMFGIQIAYGMEYLSQRGFVHRDIAARNILIDQNETCKIGDFGLCRQIGRESEQYISRGGRLPWKWMAPEALERFHFSVESDVWSFGVLLFEIITLGGTPYPDWPAVELLHRLKSGERMQMPDGCSERYYQLMQLCWMENTSARISFEQIRRQLAHELEESSGDDYYLKLNASAKYYQDSPEYDKMRRFNSPF